ncbi:hypothetical protein OAN61_00420 [bacterium]|nr:hypothetical protein [bacterium]
MVTIHRSGHCWQWNWQPWQPAAPTAVKLFFSAARYAHSCTHPPALLFLFSCETAGLVTVYKHAVTVSMRASTATTQPVTVSWAPKVASLITPRGGIFYSLFFTKNN